MPEEYDVKYAEEVQEEISEWKSNTIDKLSGALAKAQAEIKGASTESINPFFNSRYADLYAVIGAAMPALTKHGLSVIQGSNYCKKTNGFYVTTMLLHESGQWIKSEIRLPLGKSPNAQNIGSVMTYGRRYGLSAMAGVAQYDDDANSNKVQIEKEAKKPVSATNLNNQTNKTI
jgi:hypothetical protein